MVRKPFFGEAKLLRNLASKGVRKAIFGAKRWVQKLVRKAAFGEAEQVRNKCPKANFGAKRGSENLVRKSRFRSKTGPKPCFKGVRKRNFRSKTLGPKLWSENSFFCRHQAGPKSCFQMCPKRIFSKKSEVRKLGRNSRFRRSQGSPKICLRKTSFGEAEDGPKAIQKGASRDGLKSYSCKTCSKRNFRKSQGNLKKYC